MEPDAAAAQRERGLRRANAVRVGRGELKLAVAGDPDWTVIRAVVAGERDTELVARMKVHELLVAVPGVGAVKARRMLKAIGGLHMQYAALKFEDLERNPARREALLDELDQAHGNANVAALARRAQQAHAHRLKQRRRNNPGRNITA